MLTFKFLHIGCMFLAFSFFWAPDLLYLYAARRRDVRMLRRVGDLTKLVEPIGVPLFFAGVLFGFLTAWRSGFSLARPWVIIAYVTVAAMVILGAGVEVPMLKRVGAAAEASPDDRPSEELERLVRSPVYPTLAAISVALWIGLIWVMVNKPFGL